MNYTTKNCIDDIHEVFTKDFALYLAITENMLSENERKNLEQEMYKLIDYIQTRAERPAGGVVLLGMTLVGLFSMLKSSAGFEGIKFFETKDGH